MLVVPTDALFLLLEALEAPHLLLLVCKQLRLDAAEVMPTLTASRCLSWTEVTSALHKFPIAKRLSFTNQREKALITELLKGRCESLRTLSLESCSGVTDVSSLARCKSLQLCG